MISGFNSDIEFDGTVYHVQTEDKGAPAREVMSLVYNGGTILASKRSSYAGGESGATMDDVRLAEMVQRQHKLICAAISAGRIEELKNMNGKASAAKKPRSVILAPLSEPSIAKPVIRPVSTRTPDVGTSDTAPSAPPKPSDLGMLDEQDRVVPKPTFPIISVEPIIDPVSIIEDEILPADAVAVVSELSGRERPTNKKLSLELFGDAKFIGGGRHTVMVMICRGTERKVVPNAQIMIKVLGSTFRPVIFHSRSDANGLAQVHLQLPHFHAGRAALLIRATTDGEEVELRRVVTPG